MCSSRRTPCWVNAATRRSQRDGPPRNCEIPYARRRYRCASCSQVMPIPPSTWMQSLALALAISIPAAAATAAAIDSCGSSEPFDARAASPAATATCSERRSISAHMCLTAWKLPIGLPNCSRTFAYSVAVRSVHRANPAASAACTVAARSSTRCLEAGSTSAAAPSSTTRASGREKSVGVSGSTVTPSAVASTRTKSSPAGNSRTPLCVGAQHVFGGARCLASV